MNKKTSKVIYLRDLTHLKMYFPKQRDKSFLFIVDKRVLLGNTSLKTWLNSFSQVYRVDAGEELKNFKKFPHHLQKIFAILGENAHRNLNLIAIGGGSVGDFSGFVASIFKRGINFIQIPSTWLAAIDSSHGGKNGLNLGLLKNQVGTFYPAQRVFISRSLLRTQKKKQFEDALGELYKMALLTPKAWGKKLVAIEKLSIDDFWKFLPRAVEAKYAIVDRDPFERRGFRRFLNLGHTFGHVVELTQNISHGRAVAAGLLFALKLSHEEGFLKDPTWQRLSHSSMYRHLRSIKIDPISEKRFRKILLQDKKRIAAYGIQFIFLKDLGHPISKTISIEKLLTAGKKYGFISN